VDTLIQRTRPWRYSGYVFLSIILLILVGFGIDSKAQSTQQATDTAITRLVQSVAKPLKQANAKKVIVFDFTGSKGQQHPVGKWLADQVSMAIRKAFPKIEVVDRSQLNPSNAIAETYTDVNARFAAEIRKARSVGADAIVTGSFAKVAGEIGVSLSIANMADLGKTQDVKTELIPISAVITDLTPEPIPGLELRDGIPLAGSAGVTMPICIRCPAPDSPRGAKDGGVVHLEIVVTSEGRPDRIKIINSPSPDLAERAVRTVQNWLFKPTIGFDGRPIAVLAPIQVSFH
jgi:TonB family protein